MIALATALEGGGTAQKGAAPKNFRRVLRNAQNVQIPRRRANRERTVLFGTRHTLVEFAVIFGRGRG